MRYFASLKPYRPHNSKQHRKIRRASNKGSCACRNSRAVRLLHTMHAMMHYSAYRDRCTASAPFQSAALLLPLGLKLLGSFMRLILSEHVTKNHASSTAFTFCKDNVRELFIAFCNVIDRSVAAVLHLNAICKYCCRNFNFVLIHGEHRKETNHDRSTTKKKSTRGYNWGKTIVRWNDAS